MKIPHPAELALNAGTRAVVGTLRWLRKYRQVKTPRWYQHHELNARGTTILTDTAFFIDSERLQRSASC